MICKKFTIQIDPMEFSDNLSISHFFCIMSIERAFTFSEIDKTMKEVDIAYVKVYGLFYDAVNI
jgi:hypothetical protein